MAFELRPHGPAFDESEHRQRLARAREALRAAGIDVCIAVAPEHLYYLAGYDAHTHFSRQALVFTPGDDEPAFIIRDVDIPPATETSWVRDVRTYHYGADDPAQLIAKVVREKAPAARRIGADLAAYAMPAAYADAVRAALTPAEVVDTTATIGNLRLLKSEAELAYTREAARFARIGLEAARATLRAGMTEIEWASKIDAAMRDAGSEYPAMPTWVSSGPRSAVGHGHPTGRVMQHGDIVHLEHAGVSRRYHVLGIQTFAIGEASPRAREIYDIALASLRAGIGATKLGAPVAAIEHAAVQPLLASGLDRFRFARFGYGTSIAYPPTWLDPLDITVESKQVMQPGMVFVLHTDLMVHPEQTGILVGSSFAMTESGLEHLAGGDFDLAVV